MKSRLTKNQIETLKNAAKGDCRVEYYLFHDSYKGGSQRTIESLRIRGLIELDRANTVAATREHTQYVPYVITPAGQAWLATHPKA